MGNHDDDMDVEFEVVGVRTWLPHFIQHTSPYDDRRPIFRVVNGSLLPSYINGTIS